MTKNRIKKVVSCQLSVISSKRGQSLVEVVIGLAIGAILMGTAAFAVTVMLRTNLTSEKSQFASQFGQSLSDNVRSYAAGNWDGIYGLTKTTSSHYFLNASGTTFFVVQGEEGMLDGDVPDGLVGHWKFDEVETTTSTITYDATGNGNHGTLQNGAVRSTSTCKISNCLTLDEVNDGVSVSDSAAFDFGSGDFSVMLWVNPQGGSLDSQDMLVSKTSYPSGFNNRGPGFYLGRANDTFLSFMVADSPDVGGNKVNIGQNPSGQFHVAGISDSGVLKIYLNGVLMSTTTRTVGSVDNNVGLYFGYRPSAWYFGGGLDDVRLYNRALSADEVYRIYNSGVYKRFFTVENACRSNDASSTIAGTAPCSGTLEDGSTQWITNYVQWVTGGGTSEVQLPTIITRWQNAVFHQTDWSGGAGDEGAVANPTSRFSSSSNASTTGGVIQIQNLSQQ